MKLRWLFALLLAMFLRSEIGLTRTTFAQNDETAEPQWHVVQPGDTWLALAYRYGTTPEELRATNPHPNPVRQPVVGDTIQLPQPVEAEQSGWLVRDDAGSLLSLAVRFGVNPWLLAQSNGFPHPFRPLFHRAIFIAGGSAPPRDFPVGLQSLELARIPAQPGQALAFRAVAEGVSTITARLGSATFDTFFNENRVLGVGGTGAFFTPGAPELSIVTENRFLWSQPWRLVPGSWDYDQITLTGAAAEIDQASIAAERERLFQLWSNRTPGPQWSRPFQLPINNFLAVSSNYGARRSYNGGPYRTYHEGVDFSAYARTPVYAAGDGTVVLAEMLYVRGGAVIIDHGLGIYSGYYHMSNVLVQPGQVVQAGTPVGEVGATGLSTGNHLHWDLLVAETWVDAEAWHEQNLACWILEGWGQSCSTP